MREMSREEQAVIIMQDVLAQMQTAQIKPVRNIYLDCDTEYKIIVGELDIEVSEIVGPLPSCEACALGSIFIAAVKRYNCLKRGQLIIHQRDRFVSYLTRFFSNEECNQIESIFEKGYVHTYNTHDRTWNNTYTWYDMHTYVSPNQVMRAIAQNVIRNKGHFVPSDKPAYLVTSLDADGGYNAPS